MSPEERKRVVPRLSVFGGKAAPGYYMAKRASLSLPLSCSRERRRALVLTRPPQSSVLTSETQTNRADLLVRPLAVIIRLITAVSKVVNADEEIREYLNVVFLADYSVSLAEILMYVAGSSSSSSR